MPRTAFAIGQRANVNSQSGVIGVTRSRTRRGLIQWNAWGTDHGRTIRLYSGPSFDDACHARSNWELEIKNEL